MSNREMATLLNISIQGVEKSRYRLKKRLDLTVDDDLSQYLVSF
jgi:DNA-binding CsgD family transcriptional regulator